ncbi:MAG: aryl-sulfate sulfotransferase [Myxococcota bacterium]|nr:aryl-sulfate sulfotransferase [Myxococcota bacterium]
MILTLLLACPAEPADVSSIFEIEDTAATPQTGDIIWSINETVGAIIAVSWVQGAPATTWVAFEFDGESRTSPPKETAVGESSALLLGVPYGSTVTFRIVSEADGETTTSEAITATNDPLPPEVGQPMLLTLDEAAVDPDHPYVFGGITPYGNSFYDDWWTVIIDRQGRVVWAIEAPNGFAAMHPRVSYDGSSLLLDRNGFWGSLSTGVEGYIERIKIDGSGEILDLPYLRHAYTDLPDGSIVWGAINDGTNETLAKRAPDGTISQLWRCRDYMDENSLGGGCASNTVTWVEETDTFLYSIFTTEIIIEVDHATGTPLRHFGHIGSEYTFEPEDSVFWYQHNPHFTSDGTLLLSTETSHNEEETVVREYVIDEETKTLTEVWNFGIGDGLWSRNMGEAHRLPNGNTQHNYGETARLREATPDGTVVWDIDWGSPRVIGRTTPIRDLYDFAP